MAGFEASLENPFPPATPEEWQGLALKGLKGAPFEKLISQTPEGISLNPLYFKGAQTQMDTAGFPGFAPFTRGDQLLGNAASGWEIHQKTSSQRVNALCDEIQAGLQRGVQGFWLDFTQNHWTRKNVNLVLDTLASQSPSISIESNGSPLVSAALLANSSQIVWKGSVSADPIAHLAKAGSLPRSVDSAMDEVACVHQWCAANQPNLRTVRVSTLPHHQAGATKVQELAIALSTGVYYLRELTKRGVELNSVIDKIGFQFSIGRNTFMEVAKLRAARLLWGKIVQECKCTNQKGMWIHAVTSAATLTKRDPWVNILRATAGTFAAALGGANQITTLAFDEAIGLPNEFSQRIASHTQVILAEESHLGSVIDPAGGSWYIETLTNELASKAWREFQRIEQSGGIIQVLEKGSLQKEISSEWDKSRKAVEFRQAPITGVSEFPNLAEQALEKDPVLVDTTAPEVAPLPDNLFESLRNGSSDTVELLSESWGETTSVASIQVSLHKTAAQASVVPLQLHSLAEPFESLRDQSDAFLAKNGNRPSVFLANLGTIPQHKARATFAKNFFEAGGFKAHTNDGFDNLNLLVDGFKQSGTKIAVICSSDKVYAEEALIAAQALQGAGAKAIVLAGHPSNKKPEYIKAGISHFIFNGCNVYETLNALLPREGVSR